MPYFGYSTMERAVKPGEVVVAKTRARLLSAIPAPEGGTHLLLFDLHTAIGHAGDTGTHYCDFRAGSAIQCAALGNQRGQERRGESMGSWISRGAWVAAAGVVGVCFGMASLMAAPPDSFQRVGNLKEARDGARATLLTDGTIFCAGTAAALG